MSVELLSGEWVRLCTHFCGRTFLCPEDDRAECCAVLPGRNYWYLPAVVLPLRRPCLLELSATSSADLEQRSKLEYGSLGAGVEVALSRKGPKSPVRCDITGVVRRVPSLRFQEWVAYLMAIYNLPALRGDETLEEYSGRVLSMVLERANLMAARARGLAERGIKGR